MVPPKGLTTFKTDLAEFWFDEHGILCAVATNSPRSLEKQKETYSLIREITKGRRVCLLSDTTKSAPQDKAAREMPYLFKAMGIISGSALGRSLPTTFVALKDQPVPIQFFETEEEARSWLMQYL